MFKYHKQHESDSIGEEEAENSAAIETEWLCGKNT